jgi:hypothetical protein
MRYLIIVKASADSEAGVLPAADLFARMSAYHEALARAGVLLDAAGLKPSRDGWRVGGAGGKPRVIDGPFAESKGLVAGYALIDVRSRDEALEWSRRFFLSPHARDEVQIEVRPLFEAEDFISALGEGA